MNSALQTSVIIPTYNNANFVAEAIQSVLEQTHTAHEIIVVDDGSGDETQEILARFRSRIRVAVHPRNLGLPSARNAGIRMATGDLIGLLDADDVWRPHMIERQRQEFGTYDDLGLCYTSVIDCNAKLEPIAEPRNYRRRRRECVFEELYMSAFPMPPSTVFVRKEVLDHVGDFNESMLKKQDYECWLRIAMRYPVSCISEPLCLRRLHGTSLTASGAVGASLYYESLCFDLCGEAAGRFGIELPMTVQARKVLSQRRRLREMLGWGDLGAAGVYRAALEANGALRTSDRMLIPALSLRARLFSAARPICRRLRSRMRSGSESN